MIRQYKYCPQCKEIRSMTVTLAIRGSSRSEVGSTETLRAVYHCDTCSKYVCTTDVQGDDATETTRFVEFIASVPQT